MLDAHRLRERVSLAGVRAGVYCLEERCRGNGDACCRLVGRALSEWGDAITPHLAYYQKACLDAALAQVTSELRRVERRLRARRQEARANERPVVSGFILESPAMHRVIDVARRVAQVDSTVLLTGESGVGKERIARFIHDESSRAGGPFVAINCGAVPEHLLESELFGHVRGSFYGSHSGSHWPVRGGEQRHTAAGRDRRSPSANAGEAAPRTAGEGDPARR